MGYLKRLTEDFLRYKLDLARKKKCLCPKKQII